MWILTITMRAAGCATSISTQNAMQKFPGHMRGQFSAEAYDFTGFPVPAESQVGYKIIAVKDQT